MMSSFPPTIVPNRAQTLDVLRLLGTHRPVLMLPGGDDGYGTRWVLDGQQVAPAIIKYLMVSGFVAETGVTEFGARELTITDSGRRFRERGVLWWKGLGFFQRLKIRLLG
jgi:hypothetical protein